MSDRGMKKWAPFKALKDQDTKLQEMIKEKNKIQKPILGPDKIEELAKIIANLAANTDIEVTYYYDGEIKTTRGLFVKFQEYSGMLIMENIKIDSRDILDIVIKDDYCDIEIC